MKAIKMKANKNDSAVIHLIAARAIKLYRAIGGRNTYSQLDAAMDITACHLNGCPLRLAELLEADDFNFTHDVFGIHQAIDRTTGKLAGYPIRFLPRFAQKKAASRG